MTPAELDAKLTADMMITLGGLAATLCGAVVLVLADMLRRR